MLQRSIILTLTVLLTLSACGDTSTANEDVDATITAGIAQALLALTQSPVPTPTSTPSPTPTLSPTTTPALTSTPMSTAIPTLTPTSTPTPTATPTPTPAPSYVGTLYSRESGGYSRNSWSGNDNVQWTSDGSQIFFTFRDQRAGIYAVDVYGSRLQRIVDPSPENAINCGRMTYFDISPDGLQIVYSACKYPNESDLLPPSELESLADSYEIAVSNIDGTNTRMLTNNNHFDNFPVWSPDGSQIAFVSDLGPNHARTETHGRLMVYTMATGELRDVTPPLYTGVRVAPHPPAWSPDGQLIAFVAHDMSAAYDSGDESDEDVWSQSPLVVHTMWPDGGGLNRMGSTFSEPSWSPDGSRIAMVAPWASGAGLFTFAPDGSDPVFVAHVEDVAYGSWDSWQYKSLRTWLNRVYWSPDGSRILFTRDKNRRRYDPYDYESWDAAFVESWGPPYTFDSEDRGCGHRCVASADGAFVMDATGLRLPSWMDKWRGDKVRYPLLSEPLSWSPDGSRIAVLARGGGIGGRGSAILYTMDPDGNDVRVLVRHGGINSLAEQEVTRGLIAWESEPVDLDSCSNGVVVPDPEENPGLVEDCRTLLSVRDTLGGSVSLELSERWTTNRPIADWINYGVEVVVGGDPPRIRSLVLPGRIGRDTGPARTLFGRIPPELGNLAELRELNLSVNELSGPILSELGNLANLESLNLSDNYLRGNIPAELGNLTNLRYLGLSGNQLTGSIPAELGNLPNLEVLILSDNDLEGSIPFELGNLPNLRELYLDGNQLTGSIPAELGNLPNLEKIHLGRRSPFYNHLFHNQFTGCVPPGLVKKILYFDEISTFSRANRCWTVEGDDYE